MKAASLAFTSIFAALALPSSADDSKPLATQAGEAVQPYAKQIGHAIDRTVMEFFASSDGPMGDAARSNLKMQEQAERQANRGTRKTVKECIKPGNVIDDDVKECMEGLRGRGW
ncbi:hypothetical protein [Pseudomonas tohonis]|uniref:hypothetical protein n=1 Tax=Pseudomonas tohonis TaxID=2725477 RepID=UPI0022F025B5|nr:hypothetical protein [Pseudomonas tohonis]